MKINVITFIVLALFCLTLHAKTFKEEAVFSEVKAQLIKSEYRAIWQTLNPYTDDYLGDADFDFIYGVAALNLGEHERAIFAFERVVVNKPHWLDAQYYLAHGYLKMGNYPASIAISDKLLTQENLPENLQSSVTSLNEIANNQLKKQSLFINQTVSAGLGYDSNVNAGTREDDIFFPFLGETIKLSENSTETSDNYLAINYQLNGSQMLNQTSRLHFAAQVQSHSFLDKAQYNRLSLNGSFQYEKDFAYLTSNIGLQVTPLWFDNSFYRNQLGLTFGLSKKLNRHWLISADAFLGTTNNSEDENLSTDDHSLLFSVQYGLGRWRHTFSAIHLAELSKETAYEHNSRKTLAATYSSLWLLNKQWLLSGLLSYQLQDYQAPHPFFFEIREDKMLLLGLTLKYQQSKAWSYSLQTNFQDKESNLALFSYQRSDISLSTSINF